MFLLWQWPCHTSIRSPFQSLLDFPILSYPITTYILAGWLCICNHALLNIFLFCLREQFDNISDEKLHFLEIRLDNVWDNKAYNLLVICLDNIRDNIFHSKMDNSTDNLLIICLDNSESFSSGITWYHHLVSITTWYSKLTTVTNDLLPSSW